jgi:hypothetical protein
MTLYLHKYDDLITSLHGKILLRDATKKETVS